eukprot:12216937-Alexandrium_andersonii.AAC.1
MSASLVGSEMCIRDRDARGPAAREACGPPAPGAGPAGTPVTPPPGLEDCLLYTSDAADDM